MDTYWHWDEKKGEYRRLNAVRTVEALDPVQMEKEHIMVQKQVQAMRAFAASLREEKSLIGDFLAREIEHRLLGANALIEKP